MGFWSKLGKIGLAAAPYIAAPFTGGASLMATGATNKLLQKWNAKDAAKNAAMGKAPSKFDKFLGMGSNIAGMASGIGGGIGALGNIGKLGSLGKIGGVLKGIGPSKIPALASTGGGGGWSNALKGIMGGMGGQAAQQGSGMGGMIGNMAGQMAGSRMMGGGGQQEMQPAYAQQPQYMQPQQSYGGRRRIQSVGRYGSY